MNPGLTIINIIHLMLVGHCSWEMLIPFPLMTFPSLGLDCAVELAMSRIILVYVDHVVEVKEGGH